MKRLEPLTPRDRTRERADRLERVLRKTRKDLKRANRRIKRALSGRHEDPEADDRPARTNPDRPFGGVLHPPEAVLPLGMLPQPPTVVTATGERLREALKEATRTSELPRPIAYETCRVPVGDKPCGQPVTVHCNGCPTHGWSCVVCGVAPVDPERGIDTCVDCANKV